VIDPDYAVALGRAVEAGGEGEAEWRGGNDGNVGDHPIISQPNVSLSK